MPLGIALGLRLGRAQTEHVVLCLPHDAARTRQVEVADEVPESAHHGNRKPGHLALHEVGRTRDLVCRGRHGDVEAAASGIRAAAQVVQDVDARGADRDIRLAFPPWPAERVGHHDTDGHPEALAQRDRDRPRGRIRVDRQQQHSTLGGIARVDAGRGRNDAEPVFDNASHSSWVLSTRD